MAKVDDIKVGGIYWTEVSGRTVKVKVISGPKAAFLRQRKNRFVVQRLDNGKILEKMRTPHALVPAFDVVPGMAKRLEGEGVSEESAKAIEGLVERAIVGISDDLASLIGGRLEGSERAVCDGMPEPGKEDELCSLIGSKRTWLPSCPVGVRPYRVNSNGALRTGTKRAYANIETT